MKGAKGYVEPGVDRHLDTATIRRHDDGDFSAVLTIQIEQHGLALRFPGPLGRGGSGSLAGFPHASTAPEGPVPFSDRCRSVQERSAAFGSPPPDK